MNQDQNNLNQNNFNTQVNNGIPNNQPLQNNQSFNNTLLGQQSVNGNIQPNNPTSIGLQTNANQQINNSHVQPVNLQPTPSYQQQVNVQPEQLTNVKTGANSKLPKKMNWGLILGIVAGIVVIIIIGIIFISKIINNNLNNVPNIDNNETNNNETDENYIAPWDDYTAYIQGIEFIFPMTFEEFQNKIAKTTYELNYNYSLDDKIYKSYSTSNYVKYTNEVREYNSRTGLHALQYDIKVFLQNNTEESQPVSNCNVIGLEVSNIEWAYNDITDLPYDQDIYFTKKKLHLGQSMTKKELIKKFGKPNSGWNNSEYKYIAGSISSAFYQFPRFQCNMNSDNKISYINMNSYVVNDN